jgi:hypothetical protein
VACDESGLFERLTERRGLGSLAFIDVAAGLEPDLEESMSMQDNAARGDDERRGRDVVIVLRFAERAAGPGEPVQRGGNRDRLLFVQRIDAFNLFAERVDTVH